MPKNPESDQKKEKLFIDIIIRKRILFYTVKIAENIAMKAFFKAHARLQTRLPAIKLLHEMLQMRRGMYVSPQLFKTSPDDVLKNMHSVQVIHRGNANNRHVYQVSVNYYDSQMTTATPTPKTERLIEAIRMQNLCLPCVSSREEANKAVEQLARAGTAKTFLKGYLLAAVNPAKVTNVKIIDPTHLAINLGDTVLEVEDSTHTINAIFSDLVIPVIQNKGKMNESLSVRHMALSPR